MKNLSIIVLVLALIVSNLFGQTVSKKMKWEKEYDEQGIVVHTRFSDYIFEDGDEDILFEWKLETEQKVNFEKVIATLENIDLYTIIYECETSKIVSEKENSVVVYYYFDLPWPAGNIDLVREHVTSLDSTKTIYTANHLSRPNDYPEQDATRLKISDIHIKLIKISNNKTRFECSSEYIPKGAPNFLAKGWLPEGPVEFIEKIVELSK